MALKLAVASQRRHVASCLCSHRVQEVNRWELSSCLRVAWGQWLHYIGFFHSLPSVPTPWSTLERSIQRRIHSKHCNLFTNLTLLRRWYKFSAESISWACYNDRGCQVFNAGSVQDKALQYHIWTEDQRTWQLPIDRFMQLYSSKVLWFLRSIVSEMARLAHWKCKH
jgi:hypothetical protein